MKIKIVQDSIIFVSGLTQEQFSKAKKFAPKSLTLYAKDENGKKSEPVCTIAYADAGSVCNNGIVFDSTTDPGFMCKTLLGKQGTDDSLTNEQKADSVVTEFAGLVLKVNELEAQILEELDKAADKIEKAKASVEIIEL